ncbi:unnamed protein product [Calicophoron daubneyi]|uniref:RB1-inducible coiled-coil protein 1 n=1 Tax=Calicophoron daubneyi TaxID=300641 RepID=A0AAV2TDK3_CALDB
MYAFLMDKGQLVHLDPTLKSQNVLNLRNALACECELPLEKQILLVSGGFQLEPGDKLSMYDAGLFKTNPIYVFTRVDGSGKDIQTPDVLKICDGGFPQQIERRMDSPPSLQCLHDRIGLVENLTHVAEDTCKAVEQLVFEQRQMVQGWCAALANLAEAAADSEKRLTAAKNRLIQFESCSPEWEANFRSVPDLKTELSKVPLLPQLTNQLGEFWDQKETSTTRAVHPPTNLYEWICFQLALSYGLSRARRNIPLSNAARLKMAALYLGKPEMLHAGRSRTTSAELSGYGCSPKSGSGLVPPSELGNRTSMIFDNKSQYDGNNLTVACSNSSPALRQKLFCHSSLGSDGSSGDSESTTTGYDASFLSMIQTAQSDLSLLRLGEDNGVPPGEGGQTQIGEMTYTRKQIALFSGLLALVSRCSTSVEGGNKRDTSALNFEQIAAEIADGDQYLNSCTLKETHEALDLVCFSQRLSYLDPLSHEAGQHVETINSVKAELERVYEHAVTKKDSAIVIQKSDSHHEQLQHLLTAFRLLCDIFNRVMGSKLELADILRQRQQWLQNFQSEIHRLDATIQTCVRRIARVTTTGTLLSQLRGAPEIYIRGLVEVIRQQEFDSVFAENVREQKMVQANESNRRRAFAKHLKGNILHALFTPWTGAKAERWSMSKLSGSRNFSTLELDGAEGLTESMGRQLTLSTQPRAAASTLALDRQREARRISINSRSEPRLDEMVSTPPASRLSLRLRQKDVFVSRKLSELVEDEVSTNKIGEVPARSRNLSSADLPNRQRSSTFGYPQQHPPLPDALRRASVPVDSLSSIPKWTIDDNTTLDTPIDSPNVATDVSAGAPRFISREELAKLAASLPPYLSQILHSELSNCGAGHAVSGPCVSNLFPNVQHIGMSLGIGSQPSRELTESQNAAPVDASCQTDPALVTSTSMTWTSRSRSASLVIPADSSPQRPLVEELLPSSLCSWELCHGSPVRTVRHSASTNVLACYAEMTTKAVQTDEIPPEATQPPPTEVHGPPQNLANLDAEVRQKLEGLGTDILSEADAGQSRGDAPGGVELDSVLSLISNLNLEDQQGGDPEFATPTTMMSCSFHSTRTNLSNTEDAIADISASELHGVTPTMDRPYLLSQSTRHSCSPTFGFSRQVSAPVFSSGDDNCSCHLHHLHCTCLEMMHQLITELSKRSFDKSTPDKDPRFSESGQIHHIKQLLSHLSYLRSNPPSVCPVHPDSYPHPRTPAHPVGECRAGVTSLPCTPSSVSVQTDSPPVLATRTYNDRETSITPPSSLDRADHPSEGVDKTSAHSQLVPSSPSLCDELVGVSPSSNALSHLVCWKPIAPLAGPSAYLTNPLSLSSVRMLERFLRFAHSNFTCNDCVVFVPVRGAVQHSSPQKLPTCDESGADDESGSPPALSKAISPSSSMLSSTIIQSMESTLPNTNLSLPRIRNVMHTSIGPNVAQSTSALVGDLFSSPADEKMDLSAFLAPSARHGTKSRHIRGRIQPKSKISQSAESSLTQWRMLSSDGHVYFLHQDDFSALNLDPRVDYCQPVCSPQNLNVIRSRHPVKGPGRPSSSTKQRETPGSSTAPDPEARSYFVVASYQRKERCLSKRTDNRFNLPKNFAFYRVRVKPLDLTADTGFKSTTPQDRG